MCSSSAPPVGKKLSFTPLALATSIAAFALSAPNVPHMSSMVIATRGLFVGPVRIHGGSGARRRLSARRAAIGGTVGVGGEIAPPAVAGAARESIPNCAAAATEPARPAFARKCRRETSAPATARRRVGTPP